MTTVTAQKPIKTATPDRERTARVLDSSDRCDTRACTGRAYVAIEFPLPAKEDGEPRYSELLFCGHHFNANRDKFTNPGLTINDQTSTIK